MERLVERVLEGLDAALFLQIWQHFDCHDSGFIQRKDLSDFCCRTLHQLDLKRGYEDDVPVLTDRLLSAFGPESDAPLQIQEVAALLLPEEENFLFLFRREAPLDNSVEFMRIWRSYDADGSGFICSAELRGFLHDLFLQHRKNISTAKLDHYTVSMMQMFDKNGDGRLDLSDLARILALKENFLLKFQKDGSSVEERRRDFEKIFSHYDVSGTGELEGPEVDGFVKDMMELVKPSLSGLELDVFRKLLLNHCDLNNDGKIQKNELALCLGIKL